MAKNRIVYWHDEKTGACVELAGTRWDGDVSDEELLARAQKEAGEVGLDLSCGKIIVETIEEEGK